MNLLFLLFMGRLGRQCSTDNFCDFEYPTFEGLFLSCFDKKNKYKIGVSVHFSIRTKCLINMISTLKCTVWTLQDLTHVLTPRDDPTQPLN